MKIRFAGVLLLAAIALVLSNVAYPSWRIVAVDELPKKAFAVSPWAEADSTEPVLHSLSALLGYGCEADGQQWLYVKLSEAIKNFKPELNKKAVKGKLTWETNTSYTAPFRYLDNAQALFLTAGVNDAIALVRDGKQLTLNITWSDATATAFDFRLDGSRKAIDGAFANCQQYSRDG